MPGQMRICVSIPGISIKDVLDNEYIKEMFVEDPIEFEQPTSCTLDLFKDLKGIKDGKLWGLNIPNFPLESNNAIGIAGPGMPQDELFVPLKLEKKLSPLVGQYDKWRPYPAEEPISDYNRKIAKRFCNKRCKVFLKVAKDYSWDSLFYVEHSPLSLIHLDKKFALSIFNDILSVLRIIAIEWPSVPIILFSPYGTNEKESGFVAARNTPSPCLYTNWASVKEFISQ